MIDDRTISQSDGQLTVFNEPGEASTFTIPLPPSPSHPRPAPRRERVLVVEDERVVRRLVVEMLESFGYDVAEARSPQQALVICASAPFDLMVTDVVMPGGDGPALARDALKRQPEMRVLYTSGHTPKSTAHFELEGSRTAFLPKPFGATELAGHVRSLLDLPNDLH
jgi:two-component system cell cycle sensor histidine kinase/response regulator CckA